MWYLDRPGVPANGHPQGQRPCLQPVLILLGHPTKQHKKLMLLFLRDFNNRYGRASRRNIAINDSR
jgi:hypothetical protein